MTVATGATKMTPCSLNRVNVEVKGRLRGRDVKDTFSNTAKVTDGWVVCLLVSSPFSTAGFSFEEPYFASGDTLQEQSVKLPCLLRWGSNKSPRRGWLTLLPRKMERGPSAKPRGQWKGLPSGSGCPKSVSILPCHQDGPIFPRPRGSALWFCPSYHLARASPLPLYMWCLLKVTPAPCSHLRVPNSRHGISPALDDFSTVKEGRSDLEDSWVETSQSSY